MAEFYGRSGDNDPHSQSRSGEEEDEPGEPGRAERSDDGGDEPANDDDYRVGYGKPPKKHRFKKGRSGNPSGKRKKLPAKPKLPSDDLGELIAMALLEKHQVTANGKPVKATALELLSKKAVGLALQAKTPAQYKAMLSVFHSLSVPSHLAEKIESSANDNQGPWTDDLEERFLMMEKEILALEAEEAEGGKKPQ